ncbi:MAG: hypothetical protein E7187_01800 [Erysipelotrichaceae bacterium]|nr:hypothetical protein [Erysipelotrichaceae bacterium]
MAIYGILKSKNGDSFLRKKSSYYNGSLKEYIESTENRFEEFNTLFEELLAAEPELQVCVDLPVNISTKAISNQIIRYKDAFKLPEETITVPMIIYWTKDEADKAIMFSQTNYIEAKGLYYCLTEPDMEFGQTRNEVLAMCLKEEFTADIRQAFTNFHEGKKAAGALQRMLDHRYVSNVDEMKEAAIDLAKEIFDETQKQVVEMEDRTDLINSTIARAFLIKKALYVQYMMSKDLLTTRHEGDVKKQRQFAKAYSDEIPIVSLSTLWRLTKEENTEEQE